MAHVGIRIPEGLEISEKAKTLLAACKDMNADEVLDLMRQLARARVLEGLSLDPKKPPTMRELEIMGIHFDLATKILKQLDGQKVEHSGALNISVANYGDPCKQ